MIFTFGKHKGQEVQDVPKDYLMWCVQNVNLPLKLRQEVRRHLGLPNDGVTVPSFIKYRMHGMVIPKTETVLALIHQCMRESWSYTFTRGILADAMEDAGFEEPHPMVRVLERLRSQDFEYVPMEPFLKAIGLEITWGDDGMTDEERRRQEDQDDEDWE